MIGVSVLITGCTGVLGRHLKKVFPEAKAHSHSKLDVGDEKSVFKYFEENPDIDTIIHAAALTGVRECEDNKPEAWRSNVEGTRNLVEASLKFNQEIYFIYISTACVFEGTRGMYTETDIPYPKNFYAFTKYVGETSVRLILRHLIVRTNFVGSEPWRYPKAFTDRYGTYLFAEDVARGVKDVVDAEVEGVVHIVGSKKMSMYELAMMTSKTVQPMSLDGYRGPPLTVDMSLETVRWRRYEIGFGVKSASMQA